jgi:ABC-type phosphate transport system permease subunit
LNLQQTASPIIVRIIEPHEKGLGEVLLGSLGLTGVIALAAIVLGVVLAVAMYWIRRSASQ